MNGCWEKIKLLLSRTPPRDRAAPSSLWCIVANVAGEQLYGENREIKRGTKHFSAGTKVYCFPPLWGDGYEKIKVIGRHRGSRRLVTMVLPAKRLTNWRVKLVYSPQIVALMKEHWDDSAAAKAKAEALVSSLQKNND
jgi:hypothetical protein